MSADETVKNLGVCFVYTDCFNDVVERKRRDLKLSFVETLKFRKFEFSGFKLGGKI